MTTATITTATPFAQAPSASAGRLFSPLRTVHSVDVPAKAVSAMCQVLNIRYELSPISSTTGVGQLMSLYREGRSVAGYETIDQFYRDMAAEGWQIDSISQTRSGSLHFAVMKREL
ncbi:MAG: hypothetical protein AAFY33_09965 [Cyanobacteria bacterium J06643_4]